MGRGPWPKPGDVRLCASRFRDASEANVALIDPRFGQRPLAACVTREALPQDLSVDEVLEELLAVESDYRNALEVGSVELVVERDVAHDELERQLFPNLLQHRLRLYAEMAVGLGVERDDAHCGRSPVAYTSSDR